MYLICGEALFDFFLETETGPGAANYAARAGGSPFNVSIGIARQNGKAALLTGLSSDLLGVRLKSVLEQEGVSTGYAVPTARPTTLSLVGLDSHGSPAYQFYGSGSADTGLTPEDLPELGAEIQGLHFGSYSIAVAPVADAFAALAAKAGTRLVSLDPNIRPTIEPDMAVWQRRIDALLPHVDLLKISAEDLAALHPGQTAEAFAQAMLARGVTLVVVTDGGEAAFGWHANGAQAEARPPEVQVIDTVGAGDTFQATLLAELGRAPDPKTALAALDAAGLSDMLAIAAKAAAITCSRRGADLPRAADLS